MKLLVTFLVVFACSMKAQNPYATLVYDSLVIYDYGDNTRGEPQPNVFKKGDSYYFEIKPAKSKKLTIAEAKELTQKIGLKNSYGQSVASCYDPHFAAMYYKGGKAIANIEICMDCNRLDASHDIVAQNQLPQKTDEGEVYYIGTGMSRGFRLYMKALLTKYGFSHIPHGGSVYDTDN